MDKMPQIRVSCIICTYRRPELLAGALKSVIQQNLPVHEFEIIVVDNNSGDETPTVVERLTRLSAAPVRYVFEPKQGLSYARNAGVAQASSEIVAFLDDDAEADLGWLAALLEIYDTVSDALAVGGKILPIWEVERPAWIGDDRLRSLSLIDWGDESRPLKWPERIIGANCSFRKQTFRDVGLFATDLGRRGEEMLGNEDTEIQERIHELNKLVFYHPEAIVYHRVPPERLTKEYFCGRSFGNSRSRALLMARQGQYKQIWKEAVLAAIKLPIACLTVVKRLILRREPFGAYLSICRNSGFLYEAIPLLAGRKVHPNTKIEH
ncbi:MAG: glycosyltransferase family 2 protein [Leptolyngbyaceae cyanobacterium SM1_4_3]|nr:glycosyltransferase family 2 protein [Leptolyngbyaceae cyanobacterium SM1_4_3]